MIKLIKTGLISIIASFFITSSSLAEIVPEPSGDGEQGYRQKNFRAPVPATLKNAQVADIATAHQLWQSGKAVFIDVLPRPPQPKNITDPKKWAVPKRLNIKDSVWLPNVGFGRLHPDIEDYFKRHLVEFTKNETNKTLVFYCLSNCWMSWNAAKRAQSYGYKNIVWFPGGSSEWADAGYPLEEKLPLE